MPPSSGEMKMDGCNVHLSIIKVVIFFYYKGVCICVYKKGKFDWLGMQKAVISSVLTIFDLFSDLPLFIYFL